MQALGALVTAIVISFQAGWKLSLVIFCFAPLMAFAGLLQGQSQSKSGKAKSMKNWADQGAQVYNVYFIIHPEIDFLSFFVTVCYNSTQQHTYCCGSRA